ncbi:MAG: YdeI/OmpD-associated family protein [Acidimicrobiia bacterium]
MARIDDLDEPVSPDGKQVLVPPSRNDWRVWLVSNSDRQEGLWIVYRKKSSDLAGPLYDDLVEEALCFGWIDSRVRRIDDDRVIQWYSPRRDGGLWSAVNKERIARLTAAGQITDRGQAAIDQAKADSSWSQRDDVDGLVVAADLQSALDAAPHAAVAFESLAPSAKKQHLWWIYSAKRSATRTNRIQETIKELAP